ncbi:hypothetical protein AVEN_13651-1 [Araneus ventricosus]|uniref:Uncharacterized protein n=1 Tax=Araneus ventricosus TaxID=182803 RepID=A0A4Y2L8N3_ARAVE|nr:hypothetical protein AVEN_13651-1 [Araneus ventricosus]
MNTGNGSIKTLLSSRGDFQGTGMRSCWQNTAGHWYEKLLLQDTRGKFRSCAVRNLDEWCNFQVCLASESDCRFIRSFRQKVINIKK